VKGAESGAEPISFLDPLAGVYLVADPGLEAPVPVPDRDRDYDLRSDPNP